MITIPTIPTAFVKSAINSLPVSVKDDLLLNLAGKDANLASHLLNLAEPHRQSNGINVGEASIQSTGGGGNTLIPRRNEDLALELENRLQLRQLLSNMESRQLENSLAHCYISLEEGVIRSYKQGVAWMKATISFRSSSTSASPRSTTTLLSLPTEIIRLIFKHGASSFRQIPECMLGPHQNQSSDLMNASLVHSLWRAQAQAELVSNALCHGTTSLLKLALFLEQSKQVCLLRTLSLKLKPEDFTEETGFYLAVEIEDTFAGNMHSTPLWFAAKKLVKLGVHLDTLVLSGLPGPMAWSFLKEIPTGTLHLKDISFKVDDFTLDGIAPHTSRLVIDGCASEDDPAPIFSGLSTITELVLNSNGFFVAPEYYPADLSLFWKPLVPTVTSITFDFCTFNTCKLWLHLLQNVSRIGFLPYEPPEYKDPNHLIYQVGFLTRAFPKLRQFVLPIDTSWDQVELIFRRVSGPEIQISRSHNPGELIDNFRGTKAVNSFCNGDFRNDD